MLSRVAIRVPEGWRITYNELGLIEPDALPDDSPEWIGLGEDLLQIVNEAGDLLLDVGWYPDGQPAGSFALKLVSDGEWQTPLVDWRTRSLAALVAEVERLLDTLVVRFPPTPAAVLVDRLGDPSPEIRARSAEHLAERRAVFALDAVEQACARERHRPTELRIREAMRALARERAAQQRSG